VSEAEILEVLPPDSGYRRRRDRVSGRVADAALGLRQLAMGIGREIDRASEEQPRRKVLALGVYGDGEQIADAVERLKQTRHELSVSLGALGAAAAGLAAVTGATEMDAGKFANLNRLAESARPLAADWILLLDDDVVLPRKFLDRMVCVAERLGLDLAQPALSRASHGAWEVNRRRATMARQTRFVEIGPAVLLSRRAWRELTPFPEAGMGWGLCLHWAAVARSEGWKVGVVDAVPIRNEARPPAADYDRGEAKRAAAELLASSEHISREEAELVLASHPGLP
jgi:hypothetical protein